MSRKARQFWQPNGKTHPFVNAYCIHAYHAYAYILSHGLPAKKQANSEDWKARVAALETKFNFLLQFIRRWTEREEEKKKATISKRQKEIYPALSLSKAAQTLPTPRRPAFHIPRPSRTEPRQFQPLPIPVPQLYTLLIKKKMITPVSQRTRIGPQPKDYNKDLTCEYHQGEVGHTVENCRVLRHRIQDLLDQGVLKFRIEGVINTIGAEKDEEVDITSTKIPWEPLFHELKKRGLLHCTKGTKRVDRSRHVPVSSRGSRPQPTRMRRVQEGSRRQGWKELKRILRNSVRERKKSWGKLTPATPLEMSGPDPVVIRYATKEKVVLQTASVSAVQSSEKVPSVVIQVPQPFPYQDSKRIPWNYGMKVISTRESKPKTKEEVVGNLTSGLGGITRSGRCYTPEELEKRKERSGKGSGGSHKNESNRGRGRRFPPNHQEKALLKVLNEAYVPEDITGPSFENMVTSILVTNQLTFSDDELPPEGRGHTKALYISVKTNDRIVSRVLIDNGSALNVCPLSTLEKLDIDPTRVRVNSMVVRAFDGTRREVLGEIDLPVEIGPQVYDINFQVLRIDSPYNLLLGRPWLHTAGAVPSSLHQKMKLIIGNQLVTILAEEPISIYNDGEIPYIDGCAPEEASFHSFDQGIRQGGVSAWARFRLCEPRKNHNCDPGGKQRQVWTGVYPDQKGSSDGLMKPGGKELQRSSRGEKWPERKMVIPHIRATFPASAMFQVDEGDVDELALLFTEDLNMKRTSKGYRIDEETLDEDTWEDDDLPDLLPHLMVPRGLDTLEFEIFCEHGDPESHLRKYREKMALHTNNEFLMISTFHESLPECAVTWFYQLKNMHMLGRFWQELSWTDTNATARQQHHQPKSQTTPPLPKKEKSHSRHHRQAIITTTVAEEEYAGPMVEGLSIHTIRRRGGFHHHTTDPPLPTGRRSQDVDLRTIATACLKSWKLVNLANEGEEPREVKIGTRCAAEQKEALIALLREFHEIFAWSYQDMPGLDTDIVVHKIPLKPECKPVKASTATDEARSHFEDQGRGGKAIEGRFPKHSNLFGLGSQYSPGAEKGRKTTNVVFSFMDGFSGYNQIKMAEEDKSKTAFITHWGTFVYDVMPFGLKNAGATYQRAMVTLFHDMIHHEIEKYQLRLNPNKCAFGVTSGKLLGFIVSGRGIEIDPAKLTATCEPLFKLLRKDVKIKWTEDCQRAFDKIKEYLLNPPILVPPTPGRPLILYLTVQEASMGCMLGQQDETGKKEQAIYYLSKKFTEPETRYLLVEKTCCALAWASKKLRQYMLYYTTWLVSRMDPIKYIFEKPALTGKIARWQVLLSEFDILFVARKAIKGQAIADYLADYPSEQLELMDSEFPDEDVMTVDEDNHGRWKLYFDGAANAVGSGIGAVLVSPKGQQTPIAVKLGFDCTNNMTEYEACIVGLQAALEFGAYELEVFGDSLLIVSQTNGEWQARDPKLIPYQRYISRLVPKFKVEGDDVRPLRIETRDIPAYCVCIEECMNVEAEIDNKPWYYDIKRFIQETESIHHGQPKMRRKYIRRMAFQFFLSGEILYKRTHDATLLRCVDAEEANRLIQEMHAGLMGAHANGPFLARKIHESWLLLVDNGEGLHQTSWGMDVIGAITPKASNGHEFILVAIDYFTKWVEACSFKNVTQVAVTRFVKNNIICRYGMPEMLITDNASNLNNRMMDQLCQQFKIQHHNSAPYRPKMNGAVEAANKNVKKILSKMTETYKGLARAPALCLCVPTELLPVEVEIPSLRILSQTQLEEAEWAQARYEQLNFIDEKRLAALCHGQLYQRRIERAYNKKARPRTFQPGDLVLKKRNMALSDPRGKFAPSYEGPYVVKKAFSGGAIILADMDGEEFRSPINSDSVIKYHV
uniref:RNA-directed DNA polymerase n=1 Tax=Fagus sylvatica TaxID=28930 RepID=A0A2N9FEI0_FAGSY